MAEDEIDYQQIAVNRMFQADLARRRYNQLISSTMTDSPIDFYAKVKIDKWGVVTVGDWGGYLIQIQPFAYHDRLVMSPIRSPLTYPYGWDYPKGSAAVRAALRWNPQRKGEPEGYVRRIGNRRIAGQRAVLPGDGSTSLKAITIKYGLATKHQPKGR
jgi:hypothetical protein